ncbi:PorT family protein [Mucilaginibacter robiniae]|uniref:PorT family protein n=1 Tax=Mucilaginibacter robiniae TaxID=2728022 RepID=A0A7L5E5C1_9SPHI|nr:outer membrane beta-barrel protein [Mucilaginibacter robiniae]QJD97499.1 PorT family protein [Mucilaginibacter robiniae]
MRKLLLIGGLLTMLGLGHAYAQRDTSITLNPYRKSFNTFLAANPVLFGFQIGGGIGTQHYSAAQQVSTQSVATFNAAVKAILPLNYKYAVYTSCGITNKGGVLFEDALTTTTKITYLDVPVSLVRKFTLPLLGNLYVGAGGYLSRGLRGKTKFETPDSESSDQLVFGKGNDLQRTDAGLNFVGSLQLNNNLTFNASYELGLRNIVSQIQQDTGTSHINNRYLSVTLGYLFSL